MNKSLMTLVCGILTCFFLLPNSDLQAKSKHRKKHRHTNQPISQPQEAPAPLPYVEVQAPQLFVTSTSEYTIPFKALPYAAILGENQETAINFIRAFPTDEYRLYTTNFGSFYLDPIDDIIKNELSRGVQWESYVADAINQYTKPGSLALDIGAHIGTLTLVMSHAVGPQGAVFAFEPQPKIFRELFLNMSVNNLANVEFFWAGVGDHDGEIELSPFFPMSEGSTQLAGGTDEFVQLLTIDSLNLENVSLIKIDVEQQEDQVLSGAKETILRCRPVILIEIMGGYDIATAPEDIKTKILNTVGILKEMNYSVQQIRIHDYLAIPN